LRQKHGIACSMIVILIPFQLVLSNFTGMNHARDYLGPDYASNVLLTASAGEILIGNDGEKMFPLSAEQIVNKRHEGLIILSTNLFKKKWGWKKIGRLLTRVHVPRLVSPPDPEMAIKLTNMIEDKYITHHLHHSYFVEGRWDLLSRGLLVASNKGVSMNYIEVEKKTHRAFGRFRRRGLRVGSSNETPEVKSVLDQYVIARAWPGELARTSGNISQAIDIYNHAVTYPGWIGLASVWRNVGLSYAIEGRHAEAERAFRQAVALRARDANTWANLGIACLQQKKRQLAIKYLRHALSIDTKNEFARIKLSELGNEPG